MSCTMHDQPFIPRLLEAALEGAVARRPALSMWLAENDSRCRADLEARRAAEAQHRGAVETAARMSELRARKQALAAERASLHSLELQSPGADTGARLRAIEREESAIRQELHSLEFPASKFRVG